MRRDGASLRAGRIEAALGRRPIAESGNAGAARTRGQGTGIPRWRVIVSTRTGAIQCALGLRLSAYGFRLPAAGVGWTQQQLDDASARDLDRLRELHGHRPEVEARHIRVVAVDLLGRGDERPRRVTETQPYLIAEQVLAEFPLQ